MTFPTAKGLEGRRDKAYAGVVRLIDRAKAAGRLREDFTPEDLILLYMANAGVVNATGAAVPAAWRRVVALLLQAYEAPARQPLPDPPSPRALLRAGGKPVLKVIVNIVDGAKWGWQVQNAA
jgi:hypothetical protein